MGQDARVRYTKMVIREQFLCLLKQKPLSKVTVKEICVRAEINRATFYKYYCDAYDLMEKIQQDILAELHKTVPGSVEGGLKNTLVPMLRKIKENSDLYMTLFSENGDPHFPVKIFQLCYGDFSAHIRRQFPELMESQRVMVYVYTAQGSSAILNYWITTGMKESPNEIAEFIEKLVSNTMEQL